MSKAYDRCIRTWQIGDDGGLTVLDATEAPAQVWLRSCALDGYGRLVVGTFGSSYGAFDFQSRSWCFAKVEDTPGLNAVAEADGAVLRVGDAGIVWRDGVELSRPGTLCNFLLPFGDRIVTGGQTGEIYDAVTARVLYTHHSPINCGVCIERNGEQLCLLGTYSGEGLVFRDDGDRLSLVGHLAMSTSAIKGLATDGVTIFGTSANASVVFFAVATLEPTRIVPDAHGQIVNGATCCRPGVFGSVSRDLFLRLWEKGRSVPFETPHHHSVRCVTTCKDSRLVASGAYDGTIAIFDLDTRTWLGETRCEDKGGAPPPAPPVSTVDGGADPVTGEIRYLALGDSISQGKGSPDFETAAFPLRLAERWRAGGRTVVLKNLGVPHCTAADIIAHELPEIAPFKPTLITLQVGSNDIATKVPVETYRAQIRTILEAARRSGARVLVLGQNEWESALRRAQRRARADGGSLSGDRDAAGAAIQDMFRITS